MRGLFITATDTGVGKSVLSASLLAAMASCGRRVLAYKPAVTGIEEDAQERAASGWPADHELLGAAARLPPEQVSPRRYDHAVSPQLASELAGEPLREAHLLADASDALTVAGEAEATLIVEGVGGLLCPLAEGFSVCDLAVAMGLPLLIAARPGLGTINHSLLTLHAARSAGLDVRAVVLTPWPSRPGPLERSNREAICELGGVEVHTLARASGAELSELARVGGELPWPRWLVARAAAGA